MLGSVLVMLRTRVEPFDDRVLVIALSDTGAGVIAIPDKVREREKPVMGKVVEVGSEFLDGGSMFGRIRKGDILIFPDYAGMKVKIDKLTGYILQYRDINAKLVDFEAPDEPVLKVAGQA